jgi:NAD(P)H-hydrate epimerase
MPTPLIPTDPVLSLDETRAFETQLFGDDERRAWKAMVSAGRAVAEAILRDVAEAGGFPGAGRVLVLAGKGNNAGDALIAARELLERHPKAVADVLFAFGPRKLRPTAARAWRGLSDSCPGRVRSVGGDGLQPSYDLCIDGIFGYQFRTPLPPEALAAIAAADRSGIRFRAAVDLPSGLGEAGAFRGDFTYATGSVKAPLLTCSNAGRVRYLDLGFFRDGLGQTFKGGAGDRVILPSLLAPLAGLRPASSDKRSQGHLAIVGGSAGFPGAVLMTTLAALRSGVGLVTAFVPERLVPAFAARAPEAMWVGLPENADGALAPKGLERVLKGLARATALAIGPGLGRDPGTNALVVDIVTAAAVPLVIDADALQPDVVRTGTAPRILTPHAGELARISNGADLGSLCSALSAVVVAKGPSTRISEGGAIYHSLFGGPVLSRGGSGDLLAGLAGGLLAQTPSEPLLAACRAAVWHGIAADQLGRSEGQTAVRTTQLLDFLAPALLEAAGLTRI